MYEYIIVGAGSAGCLLAERLSADPGVEVLLLEAGGSDRGADVQVPAAFSKLFKTARDWAFHTAPEPFADDRQLYVPRGKMLGGSSSMNAMIYIRGNRLDYDTWAKLGCIGWSYDDLLPHFKEIENQERGSSEFHGVGGPLNVADLREINPLSELFVEAAVASGLPDNGDFNGASQEGFGFYQVTQKNGARWSAADAFLRPALRRRNLTVRTGALCERICFDGTTALGVEYSWRGKHVESYANREVILSAGAILSPHLLMLSGIGPAAELESVGIEPVLDLPGVGANLQDHPVVPVIYHATSPVSLDQADTFWNKARYLLRRSGPLTSNLAEAGGFVSLDGGEAPDIQFHFAPAFFVDHGLVRPEGNGFSVGPTLLTPQSRGRVSLLSADPLAPPSILGNLLEDDGDIERLVEGIELAREILERPEFDEHRSKPMQPVHGLDRAALANYVRATVELLYHPVGTCAMGLDPMSVVDPELRVHGLDRLRVVDASIMPLVPRGNTNAPTLAVAEKGARMILGQTVSRPTAAETEELRASS